MALTAKTKKRSTSSHFDSSFQNSPSTSRKMLPCKTRRIPLSAINKNRYLIQITSHLLSHSPIKGHQNLRRNGTIPYKINQAPAPKNSAITGAFLHRQTTRILLDHNHTRPPIHPPNLPKPPGQPHQSHLL